MKFRAKLTIAMVLLLGIPIRFAGIGERPEDLRVFDAQAFVDALLPESLGGGTTPRRNRTSRRFAACCASWPSPPSSWPCWSRCWPG